MTNIFWKKVVASNMTHLNFFSCRYMSYRHDSILEWDSGISLATDASYTVMTQFFWTWMVAFL